MEYHAEAAIDGKQVLNETLSVGALLEKLDGMLQVPAKRS